ncbi:TonB-dependent receptor [Devosia sp.]|uniref:TonB-dependent receptor domain-containing protein n=1 Tax=Devosia sp. TaxID=1871048 RepID=UPI001ACE8B2B|nr:TonB-dependent receptor [Devosia sp.]MBN9334288.1 TonB-dependent receptor [Devosia sp.]
MGLVKSRAAALMGGIALAIVAQQGAQAQNVNASNITLLERLVIGAGAPKVAINTPQAVTVLNQADLDKEQAATTGELFTSVPGVTVVGSQRQFGEAFNIRGIGTTDNSSDGSRVIINVDGTPKFNEQYRMGSFFSDPELYKQIEVLRGPASSTLYGAGAIGGVINFTTKDASDFIADGASGAIRLKETFESNGLGTTTSALLAHRLNENVDVLATGIWRRTEDATQAQGTTLTGSAFDTWSGLIKGTVRFGDNNEQVVRASYQRWYSEAFNQSYAQTGTGGRGGLISAGPGAPPMTIDQMFGIIDRKVTDQTAVLSYENPASDNPWLDLKVSLSFSDTQNNQFNHRSSTGVPTAQTGTNVLADTIYGYKTWQLKADNTVEWIGDNFENYFAFGFQTSTQDRTAKRPATALALPAHPEGTENKLGVFAQNEYIYDERLTLIAGLRSDFHWVKATTPGIREIDGSAFSPKLAAHYEINDHISVFGSLAHTERLPTIDELYSISDAVLPNPPRNPTGSSGKVASLNLRKEQANTVEGGFALNGYDLLQNGDTASIKTTGFYSDLTDLISSTGTAPVYGVPAPTYYANIASARIYGVEVEGAYNSDTWFANLAYTFTIGDDLTTNKPLTTVPQNKVVATVGGRNQEWNLEYGARVTLASKGEYIVPTASGGDGPAEAYQTLDLFASWKPDTGAFAGTQFQASIDNVFDADYRPNLSSDRSKGRTFKLTVAKQFDY